MNKLNWVTKFAEAESSGNAEAVQKAYEKLFALCYDKHLDLTALLREAEESRHAKGRVMSPDATSPVSKLSGPWLAVIESQRYGHHWLRHRLRGHVRGRLGSCGRADGARFSVVRPQRDQGRGEVLFAVGASEAGEVGGRCPAELGTAGACDKADCVTGI